MIEIIDNKDISFVNVDGIQTRFYEAGDGDPLVFVHGGEFGSSAALHTWGHNLSPLSDEFRVIALDRIGQGKTESPKDDKRYSFTHVCKHTLNFLQTRDLKNIHLIGHSRGALVVAWVTLENPEAVNSLTIVDSNTLSPITAKEGHKFYEDVSKDLRDESSIREKVCAEIEANSHDPSHITEEFIQRRIEIAHLEKIQRDGELIEDIRYNTFFPSIDEVKSKVLGDIDSVGFGVPTQVIWGVNDPSAPLSMGFELFERICTTTPQTQFHAINKAGHYPFREHPNKFNELIRFHHKIN